MPEYDTKTNREIGLLNVFHWISEQKQDEGMKTNVAGFHNALTIFHKAANKVPAYKDFLKKNKVDPTTIRSQEDFSHVPITTKENYIKQYDPKDLLWNSDLRMARLVSTSSGSTGEPSFWFRGNISVDEAHFILDDLFAHTFHTREYNTLVIIAFGMGTWIAGTYMLQAMLSLADAGHRINVITPGINKDEIIRILRRIGSTYDQTIIMGYPPFLKDSLDAAKYEKMNLKSLNLKLILSSENVSEEWRYHILKLIGAPSDDTTSTMCLYGAADVGITGMETPLLIHIRRLIANDKKLFADFFPGAAILPTMVSYEPAVRYLEDIDGKLIYTLSNAYPMIRYNLQDEGKIYSYSEMLHKVESAGYSIPKELLTYPPKAMVAVYGRPDVAAKFYGLIIYPENIKYGLEAQELYDFITQKFTIESKSDNNERQQTLHLTVELKNGVENKKGLTELIQKTIVTRLRKNNSEYNRLYEELKQKADPVIHILPYGSPEFEITFKHKWVTKDDK
jgi:phenylacetate-CoA ligase